MTLENALEKVATALETQVFTLSAPSGTGVPATEISWRTDDEILRFLSCTDDPLVVDLCERLEKAFTERNDAESAFEESEENFNKEIEHYEYLFKKHDVFLEEAYNTLFTLSDRLTDIAQASKQAQSTALKEIAETLNALGKNAYDL